MKDDLEKYKLLMDAYRALDDDSQRQILSLSNCFSADSNRLCNEVINKYYTNAISMKNNKKYESGLFPKIARMHSGFTRRLCSTSSG